MIDHVEVLKEGAGAIYGSDAIGGVVNFITRKDVEGLELTGITARPPHADGKNGQFGVLFGHSGDKGSVYVGGNYYQAGPGGRGQPRFFEVRPVSVWRHDRRGPRRFEPAFRPAEFTTTRWVCSAPTASLCASVTRNTNASGARLTDYHCFSLSSRSVQLSAVEPAHHAGREKLDVRERQLQDQRLCRSLFVGHLHALAFRVSCRHRCRSTR